MDKYMDKYIIIEDGYNTNYISVLLTSLFYVSSNIYNNMLNDNPKDIRSIYIQELIKSNFMSTLNKYAIITSESINELRNYLYFNGWNSETSDKLLDAHKIEHFYTFLSNKLLGSLEMITLPIAENAEETNIRDLFMKWNTGGNSMKMPSNVFAFFLDRQNKTRTKIDIYRKFRIDENSFDKWQIHTVICLNDHYYSILKTDNKWLMLDCNRIPSLVEIDVMTPELINKIKSECVLVFYRKV